MTFFPSDSEYMETWVNGFWLVKQWNGGTEQWQVAIYTESSFKRYKDYKKNDDRPHSFQTILNK